MKNVCIRGRYDDTVAVENEENGLKRSFLVLLNCPSFQQRLRSDQYEAGEVLIKTVNGGSFKFYASLDCTRNNLSWLQEQIELLGFF